MTASYEFCSQAYRFDYIINNKLFLFLLLWKTSGELIIKGKKKKKSIFFYHIQSRNKKSVFSADISPKNRFSASTKKKNQRKNRRKIGEKSEKNRRKIGKIADFSPKNRKKPIFPPKNRDCGARALVQNFLKKYR